MLKHLRQSMWLRCLVVLAFVFFVLPLSPNDAYASEDDGALIAVLGLLGLVFLPALVSKAMEVPITNGSTDKSTEKDDKEKVLAERFAKLNTDTDNGSSPKSRVTYPVFEW